MALMDWPLADSGFGTAALPYEGDVNAGGGGLTTSAATNETNLAQYGLDLYDAGPGGLVNREHRAALDNRVAVTPAASGNPVLDHPYWTLGGAAAILAIWCMVEPDRDEEPRLAHISVTNTLRIGLMAFVFFLVAKLFFGTFNIASISPTVEYV